MTPKQGAVALLGILLLAGCSANTDEDAPRVVQLASPGQPNQILTEDEVEALDEPEHTDADVEFVQGMIHHHAQALVMTAMVADRTASDDIPQMAERMDISQRDEISQLERWLEDRGEEVPDMSTHHDHGSAAAELMPGMLTADELAQMEATTGPDFDLLFLQYMIRHHEGARIMVADLLSAGGGQEPNIFQLAQHIDSDQSIEIARMNDLLAELAPSPPP